MDTRPRIILSAIGPDRVGLVQEISGFIAEQGANIEDSTMAALGGEFAIILQVAGGADALAAMERGQDELARRSGLHVGLRRAAARDEGARCLLSASCLDHPGIVHLLTSALSAQGVNIESMETRTENAPESGAPIFRFEAAVMVPARLDLAQLQARLSAIGEERNIDVRLAPARRGPQ